MDEELAGGGRSALRCARAVAPALDARPMADMRCLLNDPASAPGEARRRRWPFARRETAVRSRTAAGGILAAVAALWLASPAISHQEEEMTAFITALESLGCVMDSDEQAELIEERTGLDQDRMSGIVAILLQDGRLELLETMDGIRLTTPGCD